MNTPHFIESNSLSSEPIVVKTSTCPNLSGKSTLTYHIACDSDNQIYFRIEDNTDNSLFSCERIALSAIEKAIADDPLYQTLLLLP